MSHLTSRSTTRRSVGWGRGSSRSQGTGTPRRRAAQAPAEPPSPPATALVRRARRIDRELAAAYPDARCELDFETPFQLLVATVLSAQTTDKRVNLVTPALFAAYPDAAALAGAYRSELERIIQPTGFFRAKTDSVL